MSATFVTDILTVIGLSLLFLTPTIWIVPFVIVSVLLIGSPRFSPWFFARYGRRVIEPEVKLVFALFLLMYLGRRPPPGGAAGIRVGPRDEFALPEHRTNRSGSGWSRSPS